jgi:hypothetical protein
MEIKKGGICFIIFDFFHQTSGRHFEFVQPSKAATQQWILIQSFMKFDKRNPKLF